MWKVELSGAAKRALYEAAETGRTGWVQTGDEIEIGELERAGFVYDGAVTGEGYLWLRNAKR
jgi:hypothetical protein